MPAITQRRSPRTKEQLLDRLLAQDFSGNIRDLGGEKGTMVERIKPNALALTLLETGNTYYLTVHKPRPEVSKNAAKLGGDGETEVTGTTRAKAKTTGRGGARKARGRRK